MKICLAEKTLSILRAQQLSLAANSCQRLAERRIFGPTGHHFGERVARVCLRDQIDRHERASIEPQRVLRFRDLLLLLGLLHALGHAAVEGVHEVLDPRQHGGRARRGELDQDLARRRLDVLVVLEPGDDEVHDGRRRSRGKAAIREETAA